MKINVVAPLYEDWILTKLAKVLDKYIPEVVLSEYPDPDTDLNYFVNYALYNLRQEVKTKTCAFFTHPEGENFYEIARKVDWCICQAEQYAEELRKRGLRATTITPGIDEVFKPKLVLGICGRKYDGERKGEALVQELRKFDWIELYFTHPSWGTNEDLAIEQLPQWYSSLDYLLVTSNLEGGCIPAGEAIKCGKEVIAPITVGNLALFKGHIYPYKVGDLEGLVWVLKSLWEKKRDISKSVEHLTWSEFAFQHRAIFEKLCPKI